MENFDLIYCKYRINDSISEIPASIIPFYDLTIVLNGKLEYTVNDKKITVNANDAILMPPKTKRQRQEVNGDAEYISFNFNLPEINKELSTIPVLTQNFVDASVTHAIFSCANMQNNFGEYSNLALSGLAQSVVYMLLQRTTKNKLNPITLNIISFIQNHYAEKLTLNYICTSVSYSDTYCDAVFKKDVGSSVINYLIDYRIQKAKEMLVENVLSLKEIAEQTGFEDYNYFSRQFKIKTSHSPLRFRKMFNKKK